MRILFVVGVSLAIFVVQFFLVAVVFVSGCSENVDSGTSRQQVCDAIADQPLGYWLAVIWPPLVFIGSQWLTRSQSHAIAAGGATLLLMAVFWISLFAIVFGG